MWVMPIHVPFMEYLKAQKDIWAISSMGMCVQPFRGWLPSWKMLNVTEMIN